MTLKNLWTTWADNALKASGVQPMHRELGKIFLGLCFAERQAQEGLSDDLKNSPLIQIVSKRLDSLGVDCTAQVKVLIAVLSDGNPGSAVMYCHMVCRLHQLSGARVDLRCVSEAFPIGFYTCNQLQTLWGMQKINHQNMLDSVTKETFA